jgi:hypothetical protein|tara:strand:- start:203 stop:484 length:282 start_codon:yes stop_codon:yes gene_type:complete
MKTYIVKYYITFTFDNEELEVKGEMSVADGTPFSYDDVDEIIDMTVESNDTASNYIFSLYDDNEDNLVDLPSQILDKKFSSNLNITNVISSEQ